MQCGGSSRSKYFLLARFVWALSYLYSSRLESFLYEFLEPRMYMSHFLKPESLDMVWSSFLTVAYFLLQIEYHLVFFELPPAPLLLLRLPPHHLARLHFHGDSPLLSKCYFKVLLQLLDLGRHYIFVYLCSRPLRRVSDLFWTDCFSKIEDISLYIS